MLRCCIALVLVLWSGTGAGNRRAEQLAAESDPANRSMQFIQSQIIQIQSTELRHKVQDFIDNPAPTYQQKASTNEQRIAVMNELKAARLVGEDITFDGIYPPVNNSQQAAQSFGAAPGSFYESDTLSAGHHAYPGGLAVHTAFNLKSALSYVSNYSEHYGTFKLNRDVIIAGVVLHDIMKTLVFQWNADGSEFSEQRVAETGAHHILGLAELYCRGFSPEVIIATAAAHNPPKPGELRKKVVNYLLAASVIARVDPVKYGVLHSSGTGHDISMPPAPEQFIVHLSDSDYHYTEQAISAVVDQIRSLVVSEFGWKSEETRGERFNWLRNELLAKHTEMGIHQLVIQKNEHKLIELIQDTLKRSGQPHCLRHLKNLDETGSTRFCDARKVDLEPGEILISR